MNHNWRRRSIWIVQQAVKQLGKKSTHPDDEESNGDQQTLAEAK
jgi:hypothetical protein